MAGIASISIEEFVQHVEQRVAEEGNAAAYAMLLGAGFSHPLVPTAREMVERDIAWWTFARKNGCDYRERTGHGAAVLQEHTRCLWEAAQRTTQNPSDDRGSPPFSLESRGVPALTGDNIAAAYAAVMSGRCAPGLNTPERRREYFRAVCRGIGKQVNLAHLYLGSLLHAQTTEKWRESKKRRFVSTIFTTNFDHLLQRAAQLHNVLYVMTDRPEAGVEALDDQWEQAVHFIYIHGNVHRYLLANSKHEIEALTRINRDSFRNYFSRHGVIVVGYSGWDDAAFAALRECRAFDGNLYWCGREPVEEAERSVLRREVVEFLKADNSNRFYVHLGGRGADGLMIRLHRHLVGQDLPTIATRPLDLLIEDLGAVQWPDDDGEDREFLQPLRAQWEGTRSRLHEAHEFVKPREQPDAKAAELMAAASAAYLAGEYALAVERLTTLLAQPDASAEVKVKAFFNRGLAKGLMTPPDLAGAIADYDAVVEMAGASAELRAKALINRGVDKGALKPPDLAGAIADYDAVVEMPDAPARHRAMALIYRGIDKGQLTPPDLAGAIADYSAVVKMADAPKKERADAFFKRGLAKNRLKPPDLAGAIADFDAVGAMSDASAELRAKALVNRGLARTEMSPPDLAGAIADYEAVVAMSDAPAEVRVSAAFFLACAQARLGDAPATVSALQRWANLEHAPTRQHLDNDPDFDEVRNDPLFQAFRETLPDA